MHSTGRLPPLPVLKNSHLIEKTHYFSKKPKVGTCKRYLFNSVAFYDKFAKIR